MGVKGRHLFAVALAAVGAATAADAAVAQRVLAPPSGCAPLGNIQAIIDDSGSNRETDPRGLRRNAMQLLIEKPHNGRKTLGAIEFGTGANTLFGPMPIGPNRTAMLAAIQNRVTSNGTPEFTPPPGGGTDYNAAFAKAKQDNLNAQARIFLTDGEHNEGAYELGHREPPTRTFVIGLSIGAPAAPYGADPSADTNEQRLQRIADETGGTYFAGVTAATLQSTMNEVDAQIGCGSKPVAFEDRFARQNQLGRRRTVRAARRVRRFEIVVTWAATGNAFDVPVIEGLDRRRRVVASTRPRQRRGRPRVRRLRTRVESGPTFASVVFTRPRPVRSVRFRVRSARLFAPEAATAQVSVR